MMISTSAPGKVVLSGEYAVLDGAPAVAMAVDCRAKVTVDEVDAGFHSVAAPGFSDIEGRFRSQAGELRWLQGGGEFGIIDSAWQVLQPLTDVSLNIALDTNRFRDGASGEKFGVGSSAALTVALVAALRGYSSRDQSIDVIATEAHRLLQGGKGSGVDIACSSKGGLLEYRMKDESTFSLAWPEGMSYALLFSGVSADTGDKIHQYQRSDASESGNELVGLAEEVAAAWRTGVTATLLRAYAEYVVTLRRFSIDHGLGIFDAGHDALADAARHEGLVYKPCGAGGGDIGIVLGTDPDKVGRFARASRSGGFRQLDIALDAAGVTTD